MAPNGAAHYDWIHEVDVIHDPRRSHPEPRPLLLEPGTFWPRPMMPDGKKSITSMMTTPESIGLKPAMYWSPYQDMT